MVSIISSSFQFCIEGGERSTCFCFTYEAVPSAYWPVGKAVFPEDVLNRGI